MTKNRLLSFDFLFLCLITFLALCNVTVFYNFHLYLQDIGLSGKNAGFLVGLSSLTTMLLYVVASDRIQLRNSLSTMLIGIAMAAGCGMAYLFADNFWSLAIVRMINGTAVFLVMASCMVIFVKIIPPQKSGLAFSLYSVALLLPYTIIPILSETIRPYTDNPAKIYTLTACLLLPASLLALTMRARTTGDAQDANLTRTDKHHNSSKKRNILRKPVFSILFINGVYFTIFSALFYLFAGYALEKGVENSAIFFTVQMGVMIAIRLFGGKLFDKVSKVVLVTIALLLTGAGLTLLRTMPDTTWLLPTAAVFGLGMGLCVPPLNSLMYLVSDPQFRGYNANMMMLTVHLGTFIGPFTGAWLIETGGYDLFLKTAIITTFAGAGFFLTINPDKDSQLQQLNPPMQDPQDDPRPVYTIR
ncbi:MAG: MFS transporter [Proteobacteria bacterium]|nr:MFS transporter [Pseudomonadota bacterium]MBU1059993.1 MFS transporter [Pseudomonadota bacterium]